MYILLGKHFSMRDLIMNKNKLVSCATLGLIASLAIPAMATAASFSVGLWGDIPYAKNNDGLKGGEKMTRLVESMNASKLAFTVFDGDTKDGSSLCTDDELGASTITLFNSVKAPTVYAIGDNEWTDCHRTNNGSYNPLERLDYLRQTMFADNLSFGQSKIKLDRQGPAKGLYSENSRWFKGNVGFLTLNIPGSNNNKINEGECLGSKTLRTDADCATANAEFAARDVANISFLRETFALAKERKSPGLMVVIQADVTFDLPETEEVNERTSVVEGLPSHDGYDAFIAALTEETNAFEGQVVLVHGDTHFFKVDKPLNTQADLIKNFTRVETFGSPNVHWVKVNVNSKNANVFTFQPMIVPGN